MDRINFDGWAKVRNEPMAIVASVFSGLLGFLCFSIAVLLLGFNLLAASVLYFMVSLISFTWTICWAVLISPHDGFEIRAS